MLRYVQKLTLTPEQQAARTAALAEEARLSALSTPRPPPRPVGRPPSAKRPIELADHDDEVQQEPADKKRKYMQWFSSPLIHEILRVYSEQRSARGTISYLHRRSSHLFSELGESTVRSWFNDEHKLLPRFAKLLADGYQPGPGVSPAFAAYPQAEEKIKSILNQMRGANSGISINMESIRWVMQSVIAELAPDLQQTLKLSKHFISDWARTQMKWSWRSGTTAASKLPEDWAAQGKAVGQRIAATIETYEVHSSLVINLDQAGLHLLPAASKTYEAKGSKSVPINGLDDKRQITVVIASSLAGELLPLQLIFTGKTSAVLPPHTAETKRFGFHLTQSENHWSNQKTMQDYVEEVIAPFRAAKIKEHRLQENAAVILWLDVWGVHISAEFRAFIAEKHSYIHLVYVPPSCTSKLQVADVALNYPFKHGVKRRYNMWAADLINEQIKAGEITGLKAHMGLTLLKPKVLEWALESWKSLANEKLLILKGWNMCLVSHYDVHDASCRAAAMRAAIVSPVSLDSVPEGKDEEEVDEDGYCAEESDDEEKTEKVIMKEKVYGERRSTRQSTPPVRTGYMFNSAQLKFS